MAGPNNVNNGTGEVLHDKDGWREEAKSVIDDVKSCVQLIDISGALKASEYPTR